MSETHHDNDLSPWSASPPVRQGSELSERNEATRGDRVRAEAAEKETSGESRQMAIWCQLPTELSDGPVEDGVTSVLKVARRGGHDDRRRDSLIFDHLHVRHVLDPARHAV
jgi:hypothetical protein